MQSLLPEKIIKNSGVEVVACPHPLKAEHVKLNVPAGLTIAEIIQKIQPSRVLSLYAHVFINDRYIDRELWTSYILAEGDTVTIRVVPMGGGGGGKNPFKIVMTLAVIAASFYLGPIVGAYIFGGFTTTLGGIAISSIVGKLVISGIGMLALNALIPPSQPGSAGALSGGTADSPTLFIEGARNNARQFGTVPVILGEHKQVPPIGTKTYAEMSGNKQYFYMLVVWGYGRLMIDDIKIGTTPLLDFEGVEYQTREGATDDEDITMFNSQVNEEALNIILEQVNGYESRTTEDDTDEIGVDIHFARGLVYFNDNGHRVNRSVTCDIRYRKVGDVDYLAPNFSQLDGASIDDDAVDSVVTSIGWESRSISINNRVKRVSRSRDGLLSNVTDTGVDQTITEGIGELDRFFVKNNLGLKINATVSGNKDKIIATSVEITGTTKNGSNVTEVLPAFTAGQKGTVKGTKFFVSIDSIKIPFHDASASPRARVIFKNDIAKAYRVGLKWKVPERGQYEVECRRVTEDVDELKPKTFDEAHWAALRSIKNEDPIAFPYPLAITAFKIQATDSLSRVVDTLNAKVTSYALDYDSSLNGWVENPTSNPASLYRHVLQSNAMAVPLPDSRIDLSSLEEWHTYCETNGFEFNQVRDYESSVWNVLADITAAGRATPAEIDGRWGVIFDQLQTVPVQHFTPRNSWGFEANKSFLDNPHALRIRFPNEDMDWQQDERIVYDDGYDENTATLIEQLDAIGVTQPEQIWKFGRYNLGQIRLRPENWTLNVDFEHIVARRGNLVLVTHEVLLVGLSSGRIKNIITNANNEITHIEVDEPVDMVAGTTYGLSIRCPGDKEVTRQVVTVEGEAQTLLELSTVIDLDSGSRTLFPDVGDLYGFGEFGSETIEGIIKSIEPLSDMSARINIIPHSSQIYDMDTGEVPDYDTKITNPFELPAVNILSVRADESALETGGGDTLIVRIGIEVEQAVGLDTNTVLDVQIRNAAGTSSYEPATVTRTQTSVFIRDVEELETYNVRLRWYNPAYLLQGAWTEYNNIYVIGATNPPDPLSGYTLSVFGGSALVRWDEIDALDVRFGGSVVFRHSHQILESNASWEQSVSIGTAAKGTALIAQLPLKAGTYMAKVQDRGGRLSTVVKMATKQASINTFANVDTVIEEPTFSGTHTNTAGTAGQLILTGLTYIDDWADVDAIVDFDSEGGIATSGTYDFAANFDFGAAQRVRLTTDINVVVYDFLNKIDSRAGNIDDWDDFDGIDSAAGDARIQERHTDDDPTGSPVWSNWNNLESAEFESRAFDFRVNLSTVDSAYNIRITKLQIVAEDI